MELGISPIVTSGLIMQLLAGAKLIGKLQPTVISKLTFKNGVGDREADPTIFFSQLQLKSDISKSAESKKSSHVGTPLSSDSNNDQIMKFK